ncbi:MAG: sterol desaturase family protein [Hyphomicrobiaceae bacterium]
MDVGGFWDVAVRFGAFAGIFLTMALLELFIPKRTLKAGRGRRWPTNLAIVGIDGLLVRLMVWLPQMLGTLFIPLAAVAAALYAERSGFGLLNWVAWPAWLEIAIAVVVLDFALWLQHFGSHKIAVFWRLHQMHHADVDIDTTTGLRFHPIEIGLSMLYKMVWVLALGAPPIAVVLFEAILNGGSLFNHANVDLPRRLDRVLRLVLVTPDMHRVHHSILRREHDTNFGFNLSVWDRLLGTYTAQPEHGHRGMTIGLPQYQSDGPTRLGWSLTLPFRRLSDR